MSRFFVFVVAIVLSSCHQTLPSPIQPILVRPSDLVQAYHDDRAAASIAYDGIIVVVPIHSATFGERRIFWSLIDKGKPAIEFIIEHKSPKGTIWIQGTCLGRRDDGKDRGLPGYNFKILIDDCQIVQPPAMPRP